MLNPSAFAPASHVSLLATPGIKRANDPTEPPVDSSLSCVPLEVSRTWSLLSGLAVPTPTFPPAVVIRVLAGVAWFIIRPALFPAVNPPAKVEVAEVPVAWKLRAYGLVVAVTLPEGSRERSDEGLTFARFKTVPESNVNVPDVKLSEVSLLKNCVESKVSKV